MNLCAEGNCEVKTHCGASQHFMKLAEQLSNDFTVYIPDRRGRGLSGPYDDHYSLTTESKDLRALIKKTGTQNIFGLSVGAVFVLQTSIIESSLNKVARYEPPIPVNGTKPTAWISDYEQTMTKGNLGKAMLSTVQGNGDPLRLMLKTKKAQK